MAWGQITDERIAEAAALIGQPLRRTRMQWIETATRDAIRHFAWGIGDDNPLWVDREYANASPLGGITAPPCLLYALDSTIVAPKLAGVQWIYAGTDFTWYEPIREGDTFSVDARLTEQVEKSGRRFARWVLQSGDVEYRNQHGRLAAKATGHVARTPRLTHNDGTRNSEPEPDPEPQRYSPEELAQIEHETLNEYRRGADILYWEDVAVGEEIPTVVKGPLTTTDILAWYSATQGALHYGGAHGDAIRYRTRHADYHLNEKTGAKDSAGRGHLESGTGKDVGMGGAYDIGPQRIAWAQHMLCNWMGDHGFLHQLSVSVRRPNLVGSTIRWYGRVTGKRSIGDVRLVDLEVEAKDQRGAHSAGGTAVVALPSREAGPVVFPLAVEG